MIKHFLEIMFHAGHHRTDGINLRRWLWLYTASLTLLAGLALITLRYYDKDTSPFYLRIWLLALYLFYMSLCCSFFPAPTAWLVLLMASPVVGLFEPGLLSQSWNLSAEQGNWAAALLSIVTVAAVGSLGTAAANLNEYHLFTFFLRFGQIYKIRNTRLYHTAGKWFSISPFSLVTVFSFLPVPVDVVRWLAITHRYRRDHYVGANFIGRFFRYAFLAAAATCLKIDLITIVWIQAALIVLVLLRYLPRLKSNRQYLPQSAPTTNQPQDQ